MSSTSDVELELQRLKGELGAGEAPRRSRGHGPGADARPRLPCASARGGAGVIIRILGEGQYVVDDAARRRPQRARRAARAGRRGRRRGGVPDRAARRCSPRCASSASRCPTTPWSRRTRCCRATTPPSTRSGTCWSAATRGSSPADGPLPLPARPRPDRPDGSSRCSCSACSSSSSVAAARRTTSAPSAWSSIARLPGCAQWFFSDRVALYSMGGQEVSPAGGARAARHHRPALRAGRHAQAQGRDRRLRRAERVRHRPQPEARRGLRDDRHHAPADARPSSRACCPTSCPTSRTATSR